MLFSVTLLTLQVRFRLAFYSVCPSRKTSGAWKRTTRLAGKPQAQEVINTMVMVARVSVLLESFQTLTPTLYEPFRRCWEVLGSPQELPLLQEIYPKRQHCPECRRSDNGH